MDWKTNQSRGGEKQEPRRERWKRRLLLAYRRATRWGQRRVPPGVRSVLGVLLVLGGMAGFLPILGFWMIPLGIGLLALDFPVLRRQVEYWLAREKATRKKRSREQKNARDALTGPDAGNSKRPSS